MGVISINVGDEITIVIPVISLLIAGWPLDGGKIRGENPWISLMIFKAIIPIFMLVVGDTPWGYREIFSEM